MLIIVMCKLETKLCNILTRVFGYKVYFRYLDVEVRLRSKEEMGLETFFLFMNVDQPQK